MLWLSRTKVAQIESVSNNLIPEFKQELNKKRITFSAAYELSGMTEDEQREALAAYKGIGRLTHKDIKVLKDERAAEKQNFGEPEAVSGSDTGQQDTENIGMDPPEGLGIKGEDWECSSQSGYHEEEDQGGDYETPHPEGITSICYSCTEYETCNVKTGTCTKCDQYKNRAEAYKTEEQKYSEEQERIGRETKKKLREMQQDEKMDDQLVEHLIPVPVSLRPFLRYILACQVQYLFQRCITWKYTFCFRHFPVLAVQSFYDICGVHDPADVIRELEERAYIFPVIFPVADGIRVFSSPHFFYVFQL